MNIKRHRHLLAIALTLLVVVLMNVDWTPREKKEAVGNTATQFLELIDAGRYGEAWDEATGFLQQNIPRDRWIGKVAGEREGIGALLERSLSETGFTSEASGGPEGEYAVLVYQSRFQHKGQASEKVTLLLGSDAVWRVAGYFIE
ncbi:hypothetical protein DESUT3_13100 [Desulfuromonas versatilis]|uniref:DUF4019 domain-containing protein n=1 Tax=Desulfuromonas versatilis TaxID=2802975 RepID=A0ABM8HT94_9BACT|nr:DUF4019 domain-containing protein [Desulfuromonas versatilis]BCR04241.1 hypothetical protein DESUT3_13100 [Desulfuromonas versatilis]